MEVREARELSLAFFYHLAVQRLVRNPLEDHHKVAGITNYVDFGLQVRGGNLTAVLGILTFHVPSSEVQTMS